MAGFTEATIAERIDITGNLAIIRVVPPAPIGFTPGQFVRLGLAEANGRILQRSYTIVSAPHEPLLEFFLELVPGGRLTPRLWELSAGDTLLLHDRPAGIFTLDSQGASHHLMAATTTGIAPYISMIRAHLHARTGAGPFRMLLLHSADGSREFGPYLRELRDAADGGWLTYVPTIQMPMEEPAWSGETGRIEDIIRKHGDALDITSLNSVAYACGHPEMIENVRGVLMRARYTKGQIHTEKYFSLNLPKRGAPS